MYIRLQERGAADEAVIRDGNLAESSGDQAGDFSKSKKNSVPYKVHQEQIKRVVVPINIIYSSYFK